MKAFTAEEKILRAKGIIEDRESGMTYDAIALKWNVSADTVQRIWRVHEKRSQPA